MGLNIKNETTHAKVRRLAALTGLSQTAAVDEAVERRLRELGADERADRQARASGALERLRHALGADGVRNLRQAESQLYDPETGLPR